MKIRSDFVTNSSSSSFIIAKKYLDEDQLEAIRDHVQMLQLLGYTVDYRDAWDIDENSEFITGDTHMDNISMETLFREIDVPDSVVTWGESGFSLSGYAYEDPEEEKTTKRDWRRLLHESKD